jgi:hypothetical protein
VQLRERAVVGRNVDAVADVVAADEPNLTGVVGGGEEVGVGQADVALSVNKCDVTGAVADALHVVSRRRAAVQAVGGAQCWK